MMTYKKQDVKLEEFNNKCKIINEKCKTSYYIIYIMMYLMLFINIATIYLIIKSIKNCV
jgi:hypothetical protein